MLKHASAVRESKTIPALRSLESSIINTQPRGGNGTEKNLKYSRRKKKGSNTLNQTCRLEWLKPSSYVQEGMRHRPLTYNQLLPVLNTGCASPQSQHGLIASLSNCRLATTKWLTYTERSIVLQWTLNKRGSRRVMWNGLLFFGLGACSSDPPGFISHWGCEGLCSILKCWICDATVL